ncbi:MAG: alpha/beta fold hydrolase [Actinomycetes bacterium]
MLDGRELAYCQYGDSGPVIILIHGVGASGECWEEVAPLLAAGGVRVIAVDLPGHGQSIKMCPSSVRDEGSRDVIGQLHRPRTPPAHGRIFANCSC